MDKHEDTMAKFGAMLASGILDAGGRNLTIALISPSGHVRMPAVVGLAVFAQYWCAAQPSLSDSCHCFVVRGLGRRVSGVIAWSLWNLMIVLASGSGSR